MRNRIPVTLCALVALLLPALPLSGTGIREPSLSIAPEAARTLLPQDPAVRFGRLANGVTYYVRENAEPENRAFLRLVVNVGSMQEDDDQLGLAHFAEHMAFRGTADFEGSEIVEYLESLGMRFGPDINAYTSFEETVYRLQVPTDQPELVERGFHVLEQWAHQVSFDPQLIDRERGVIYEEWRVGRGAQARMRDRHFPVLFAGSRYAERLPIGDMDIVMNFEHDTLRRFYHDWYRPELMAVIAVGDFDARDIEDHIRTYFGPIPRRSDPRRRETYTIPDHDRTLYAIASDPEASRSSVFVYNKVDPRGLNTIADYRESLQHTLFASMLNTRFREISEDPDARFITAGVGHGMLVRAKYANFLSVTVEDQQIDSGLAEVIREVERVRRFGFTQPELERARLRLLRSYENAYDERDRTSSSSFVNEYTRHFLHGEAFPGIAYEYRLAQKLIPAIGLDELDALADGYLADRNRVVTVSAVEREDVVLPAEQELRRAVGEAIAADLEPWQPQAADVPLIADMPAAGEVTEEHYHDRIDTYEWRLSNGARVVLKQTDFRSDEVQMSSFSMGGHSLASDDDHPSALLSASIVEDSGLSDFSPTQLAALLAGQRVSVSPYVNELTHGFSGSASPRDLETMLQLLYLYATEPRRDESAFRSFMRRRQTEAVNRERQPEAVFSDRLRSIYYNQHPRFQPLGPEVLERVDLDRALEFYNRLFADFSTATFVFVGNVSAGDLRPLVERYLAPLPARDRPRTYADVDAGRPDGIVRETIEMGLEPQSRVALVFHGDHDWNRRNNHLLRSLGEVLRLRLREVLREEEGGTYGVGAGASPIRLPRSEYLVQISFGTDPDRAAALTDRTFEVIDELRRDVVGESYIERVRTAQLRSYETNLRSNAFWVGTLREAYIHEISPDFVLDYPRLVDELTAENLMAAAQTYLNDERFILLTLMPQR
ncbi:MAG: insulinase family protein [Spirochaetaceae bacterium]|nr:MAG: insulinase family protein [Spirochaetaceae bacterium]